MKKASFFNTNYIEADRLLVEAISIPSAPSLEKLPLCLTAPYPNSNCVVQCRNRSLVVIDLDNLNTKYVIENVDDNPTNLYPMNAEYIACYSTRTQVLSIWSFRSKRKIYELRIEESNPEKISCLESTIFFAQRCDIYRLRIEMDNVIHERFNQQLDRLNTLIAIDSTTVLVTQLRGQMTAYLYVSRDKVISACDGSPHFALTPQKQLFYTTHEGRINIADQTRSYSYNSIPEIIKPLIKLIPLNNYYLLVFKGKHDFDELLKDSYFSGELSVYSLGRGRIIHTLVHLTNANPDIVFTSEGTLLINPKTSGDGWYQYSFTLPFEKNNTALIESKDGFTP